MAGVVDDSVRWILYTQCGKGGGHLRKLNWNGIYCWVILLIVGVAFVGIVAYALGGAIFLALALRQASPILARAFPFVASLFFVVAYRYVDYFIINVVVPALSLVLNDCREVIEEVKKDGNA